MSLIERQMRADIPKLDFGQLKELLEFVKSEINKRMVVPPGVTIRFETQKSFDPRPHGAAYAAILKPDGRGGVDRLWARIGARSWDPRKKTYFASYILEANENDFLECRLKSSSHEDKKEYYVIFNGAAISCSREEAIRSTEKKED